MEWHDDAIVLGVRRHGETSVIAEVMTREHGRHMGLCRNGRSRAMQPVLQPGNQVSVTWRARLDEHLGLFRIEPVTYRAAALMDSASAIQGVQALAALLRLLPERDPHPHLYEALDVILDNLTDAEAAGELYVRFELAVLDDLGFGLDLARCAATGSQTDLVYVSPKTGRAVSRDAGTPYRDRMLALPDFLAQGSRIAATRDSLAAGFRLSGWFLNRHVYEPRGIEPAQTREGFIQSVIRAMPEHED